MHEQKRLSFASHLQHFIAMAELPTVPSEVNEQKKRHMIDMAIIISELTDVQTIVKTTLRKCQRIRNQYITELFGDSPPPTPDSDESEDGDDGDGKGGGAGKDHQGNAGKDQEGNDGKDHERAAKRQKIK